MNKIVLITTREEAHVVRSEVVGHPEAGIHRGKKETIALGKTAWHNKPLFNIHEEGRHDTGVKIISHQIGKIFHVFIQDDTEVKPECGDSFEEALGKSIKHNKNKFNVGDIHHVE